MPKFTNFNSETKIEFFLNLLNSKGFIYNNNNCDYNNWIPCDMKLNIENEVMYFKKKPTLSLETIKYLFQIFNFLTEDFKKGNLNIFEYSKEYNFSATEGEFDIQFSNPFDDNGEILVSISILCNMSSVLEKTCGYHKGFRFAIYFEELKSFFEELNEQLYDITDGNEGKKEIKL